VYDVYVIIDDNSKDYTTLFSAFNNINIIQIKETECARNGFKNMNFTINKVISGWEKAVYYFSSIKSYENVWFFEDDVFFYNEQCLLNIDSKYPLSDLLSNTYDTNISGIKKGWNWDKINIKMPAPYYKAMVCCVRMSYQILSLIKTYAQRHKTLFFLEALFPTLCIKNNLQYDTPAEFENIVYRKTYQEADINKVDLFHPLKNISMHAYYRTLLSKNEMIGVNI